MGTTKKTAAALGLFDGVHLGHRAVLRSAAEMAEQGLCPCAFTFPPDCVSSKGAAGYIYGEAEKRYILGNAFGIMNVISPPFSDICGMDGESFARDIVCGEMNAAFVCCGEDFRFGRGASCGISELARFGEKYGFAVKTVEDVYFSGRRVSSTAIRSLLEKGDVRRAGELLGEPYMIMKTVERGAALGRTIGFPTINQLFDKSRLVPAFGVYASRTYVEGTAYPSVTDIGVKPTVDYGGSPLAETHICGFSGDLYGKTVRVSLIDFIRREMKFSSLDELRGQINSDIKAAMDMAEKSE